MSAQRDFQREHQEGRPKAEHITEELLKDIRRSLATAVARQALGITPGAI